MRRGLLPLLLCLALCACAAAQPGQPEKLPEEQPEQLPEEPAPVEEPGPAVHTDWSKLGERAPLPEPVGSRWYGDYMDELLPRGDYGPLVPYAGLRLMDNWPAMTGCLYGLMTRDGVVVTDPVYSLVICPNGLGKDGPYAMPLLVMKKADPSGLEDDGAPAVYAVAARDGSWCTPFDYLGYTQREEGLLLFQRDSVTVMAPDGSVQRIWTREEMGLSREEFDSMLTQVAWREGGAGDREGDLMAIGWVDNGEHDTVRCFDLITGESSEIPDMEFYSGYPDWEAPSSPIPDAWLHPDSILGSNAPGLWAVSDYSGDSPVTTYYCQDGTPLPQLSLNGQWYRQVELVDGLVEVLDWNTASYYDLETWECVFRTYLNYEGD